MIGVIGIGIATFVVARFAQRLLASDRLQRRHMQEQIDRLGNHYIICGFGRVGYRLAEDLFRANRSFVVIDVNENGIQDGMLDGMLHLVGDAEDDETLRKAGIDRAEGVNYRPARRQL